MLSSKSVRLPAMRRMTYLAREYGPGVLSVLGSTASAMAGDFFISLPATVCFVIAEGILTTRGSRNMRYAAPFLAAGDLLLATSLHASPDTFLRGLLYAEAAVWSAGAFEHRHPTIRRAVCDTAAALKIPMLYFAWGSGGWMVLAVLAWLSSDLLMRTRSSNPGRPNSSPVTPHDIKSPNPD